MALQIDVMVHQQGLTYGLENTAIIHLISSPPPSSLLPRAGQLPMTEADGGENTLYRILNHFSKLAPKLVPSVLHYIFSAVNSLGR